MDEKVGCRSVREVGASRRGRVEIDRSARKTRETREAAECRDEMQGHYGEWAERVEK